MALSRPGVGITASLSIVLLLALSGCGSPVTEDGAGRNDDRESQSITGCHAHAHRRGRRRRRAEATRTAGEDPAQSRVRTGPVAQYGGPAYGDQGVAEIIEAGLWCKTIKVFWGGDVPGGRPLHLPDRGDGPPRPHGGKRRLRFAERRSRLPRA